MTSTRMYTALRVASHVDYRLVIIWVHQWKSSENRVYWQEFGISFFWLTV